MNRLQPDHPLTGLLARDLVRELERAVTLGRLQLPVGIQSVLDRLKMVLAE